VVDGVFLCRDWAEVEFVCQSDGVRGPVDIWAVEGVEVSELIEAPDGFVYSPNPISSERLRLAEGFRMPEGTGPYQSRLTIVLDDGRVLHDQQAHELLRDARAPD
jgi:hypothetical protein